MNRIIRYIFRSLPLVAAAAVAFACSKPSEDVADGASAGVTLNADGSINVGLCIEIPGMTAASTRTMGEAPDFSALNLYMLVFEEGEGLKQYAKVEPLSANQPDGSHSHSELVTYTLTLEPTTRNAVVHLVATNQPDFEQRIGFGPEERVITALSTDNGYEAYWQRRDLGCNIPTAEQLDLTGPDYDRTAADNAAKIAGLLSHVPMIRNFCRISVVNKAEATDKFKLTGFYVVNTVDRGSVAPYVADNPVGERFVNYYNEPAAGGKFAGKTYNEISAQNHIGSMPNGVMLINTIDDVVEDDNVAPVYFYERPARENSTERTFVILRGKINDGPDCYYKVDIGFTDEGDIVGLFRYFNLLRNIDYVITLNHVSSNGYPSLKDAAEGVVYNNFSASVEARNMVSVSDGDDMIFVNFTSHVFTRPDKPVDLLAQFRTEIGNGTGGHVHNELITYKLEVEEGDVISSITESKNTADSFDAWNTYRVSSYKPDNLLRQQVVYIYRGNKAAAGEPVDYGLYRVVTFFLHEPWPFIHIDTFPGSWDSYDQMIEQQPDWGWNNTPGEVGDQKGAKLTLFFELPAGLPQALFPLSFVIESDRQNIQNDYVGNAVVRSVDAENSLFYEEGAADNPKTSRIQYVKTVTWEDYNGEKHEELVGTGSTIIRCRFRTITDLGQDGVGGDDGRSATRLRVANDSFGKNNGDGTWTMYHEDSFIRDTDTPDPDPNV